MKRTVQLILLLILFHIIASAPKATPSIKRPKTYENILDSLSSRESEIRRELREIQEHRTKIYLERRGTI